MKVQRSPEYLHRRMLVRRERNAAIIKIARGRPCHDCGLVEPAIMQFDHVPERGKKAFGISSGKGYAVGVGVLLREITKCDVVCPNCHVRRTIRRTALCAS